jgi:ferredoxin
LSGPPPGFRIRVAGSDWEFPCGAEDSVLRAMERGGVRSIAIGCRGGGCGFCRVHVDAGDYRTGRMSVLHVDEGARSEGYALACRLYPLSDLVLSPARITGR